MKKHFSPGLILMLLLVSLTTARCSKEDIQKNLVIDAMTNGRWLVQQFTENSLDVSSEFSPWEFQFLENGQVQAISGPVQITGTWTADANARTISSAFPAGNTTLQRLNDTWKIFNNTFTLVEANPTSASRTAYLKLVKK